MTVIKKRSIFLIAVSVLLLPVWLATPSQAQVSDHNDAVHTKEELTAFIRSPRFKGSSIRRYLTQADVPVLIDMLNDRRNWEDSPYIAVVLATLDEGTEAQHAIIHYIKRGDGWPWRERARLRTAYNKISVVNVLARTNGDLARRTAREALTEAAARQLVEEWIGKNLPGPFKGNPERVVALVRSSAAFGLVLGQDEEGIREVEELFESVAPLFKEQRRRVAENSISFTELPQEEQALGKLYHGLIDALATRDLIEDIGYEQYRMLKEKDNEVAGQATMGYMDKYFERY